VSCINVSSLLTLVINGERACYKSPSFAPKIQRTRSFLLADLAKKYVG
jgi:RAP1 GTPase activating protein 1